MSLTPDASTILDQVRVYGKPRRAMHAHAAATYARQSTERQKSIPEQQAIARQYVADRLGLPIVAEFTDVKSGLTSDRAGYQDLLTLARSGRISHVVTFRNDRLGRDDVEFITAMRTFEHLGIEVHDALMGKLEQDMAGLHGWLSNKESRTISARVLPMMKGKVEKGQAMQRPPLGFKRTLTKGVFEPDEHAPLITELFSRYAAGESVYSLTAWFNAATGLHKRTFGVVRLLQNPYYAGVLVWGRRRNSKIDGQYVTDRATWAQGAHSHPLVDRATWDKVQARLSGNRNVGQERASGPQYPLTGLVWCAACGKRVHGQLARPGNYYGGQERTNTAAYMVYHCPHGCGRTKSNAKVEGALRRLLEQVPIGVAAIAALGRDDQSQVTQARERAADVARRIDRLHERRKNLTTAYADGLVPSDAYASAIAETDQELAALQAEQANLDRRQGDDASAGQTLAWLQSLDGGWTTLIDDDSTVDERNDVYRLCVRRVVIDFPANSITVEWMPALARLLGTDTSTVPLLSKGRKPRTARERAVATGKEQPMPTVISNDELRAQRPIATKTLAKSGGKMLAKSGGKFLAKISGRQ